jgi:hypothetical protein
MGRSLLIVAVILAAYAGTLVLRIAVVDRQAAARESVRLPEESLKSPGGPVAKLLALEHGPAVGDLIWLGLIQELSKKPTERDEASWDRVERLADLATDFDDRYFVIYYASAVQLTSWGHRGDRSDRLLRKGEMHLPDRWEFPLLLGYNAYFIRGDAIGAATEWQRGLTKPDPPRFFPSLVARARFQGGDEQGAIAVLEAMIEFLDGPHRDDAVNRLKILKSEPVLRRYDEACLAYQAKHGSIPVSGRQLFDEHWVADPPVDLFDKAITIDEKCRARTEFIFVREDEAKARVGSQAIKTSTASRPLTPQAGNP